MMRDYTTMASKHLLQNKKRTILTLIGIVIAYTLFSSILTLFFSYKDLQIQNAKQDTGNYEVSYKQVNEVQLDKIIHNAEVLDYGVVKDLGIGQIVNSTGYTGSSSSIQVKSYDKQAYNTIFNNYFQLIEGRLPCKENEIVLDARALYSLKDKKLGDKIIIDISKTNDDGKIIIEQRDYIIVGTYEENIFSTDKFYAITFLDDNDLKNKNLYDVFVNLKEKKNKIRAANNIANDVKLNTKQNNSTPQIMMNTDLISLENNLLSNKLVNQIAILFAIIIACCVAIIYNDFNISIIERIEQFGILRSIGATPKQIKKLVYIEAFYMCIAAIPIGQLTSYFGLYGILEIVKKINSIDNTKIQVKFYPIVLLISILLVIITVALSVLSPAKNAGKVSPIDAIKSVTEIKNERVIRRKTRLAGVLFNFEGDLAYKNIRRIPRRFWITVSSLIVSMTLFIVYSTYVSNVYKYNSMKYGDLVADARFEKIDNSNFTEDDYNEISSIEGIDKIYKAASNPSEIIFPKEYGNLNYEKATGNPLMTVNGYENYIYAGNSIMSYYDDNGLEIAKKYLIDGAINKDALSNMGVLLVRKSNHDYSTYKVGDVINIPKIKSYQWGHIEEEYKNGELNDKDLEAYNMKTAIKNNEFYSLTVVGIVSNDFLYENNRLEDGLDLVLTEGVYKKINGNLDSNGILIKFKNKKSQEKLYRYFNNKAEQVGGRYTDYYYKAEQEQNRDLQQQIFIYGVIILITLISIINIINSIGINIVLRKREFACLQAIGMTRRQLTKMIMLEGLIHGLIAFFVSVILSSYLITIIMRSESREMPSNIPLKTLLITLIGALLLTIIASLAPLRKLKEINIIEGLKMN